MLSERKSFFFDISLAVVWSLLLSLPDECFYLLTLSLSHADWVRTLCGWMVVGFLLKPFELRNPSKASQYAKNTHSAFEYYHNLPSFKKKSYKQPEESFIFWR